MLKVFLTVIVLVAIVIGLGIHFGWFEFWTKGSAKDDKQLTLGVDVDTGKIKEDAQAAKQKAQELGATVKEKITTHSGAETAKGEIVNIAEMEQRFTVATTDKKTLIFHVEPTTKVQGKETQVDLKDLHVGDHVTVSYEVKDGMNVVQSINMP